MSEQMNQMFLALRDYILSLPLKPRKDEWYEFSVKLKLLDDDAFKFVGQELIATKDKFQALTPIGEEIEKLIKIKNEVYSERNKIIAAFAHHLCRSDYPCRVYRAYHEDPNWEDDWRNILVIEIENKQMAWHFHDSEKYLLEGLPAPVLYKYNGHTTEEKYKDLLDIFLNLSKPM